MGIEYRRGDIFDSGADVLTVPVNCVGVMGAGLAKQFKHRFPGLNGYYVRLCREGRLEPGVPELVRSTLGHDFMLFPTKKHWKDASRIQWIDWGLERLADLLGQYEITSIAIPPLGCGLGGLPWSEVKPLIEQHLGDVTSLVVVYEPRGAR